jgi:hypothetical protein
MRTDAQQVSCASLWVVKCPAGTLLLNWFRAKGTIPAGIIEGFNNKAKLTMRKSYGFREYETIELALYHQLGNLPQPEFTHEFC